MKNNTLRTVIVVVLMVVLVIGAFGGGVLTGGVMNLFKSPSPTAVSSNTVATQVPSTSSSQTGTPTDLKSLFAPFWQTWDLVHQSFVHQPVDDTKLMEGAITGMLASLGDSHTGYSSPQETTNLENTLAGSYGGIGAYVDTAGTYITITQTIPGYPAEKAGLLPGDQIIAVDGVDVTGMDPDIVRQTKVMGPEGTSVTLTISRIGADKPIEFTLTRAQVVIPSVTSKMLANNIAYVQITVFGDTTATDLHTQLQTLMAQNPVGLVLDLRNNGGGSLDTAISVASEFIGSGLIMTEKSGNGSEITHNATSGGLATKIPLVVLVNQNTASASEIVSGAIQEYARGKLVGVTTYGKGTVQEWYPLPDGGTARISTDLWLLPKGDSIDKKGLTPDIVVQLTQADTLAGKDPQLDAAVQALSNP